MTLADDAVAYAAQRHWHVHPIAVADKTPLTRWRASSTDDPADVEALWSRWPDANVGVDCGKSGLVVIDVDDLDSLPDLHAQGPLPPTLTARTGRGGLHLYYLAPDDTEVGNSAGVLADGVDVRAQGGYVVAPSSRTAAGRYTWVDGRPPTPLPGWVPEANRRPAVEVEPSGPGTADAGVTTRWGESVLEREMATFMGVPEGQRNDALYRAALKVGGAVKAGQLDAERARTSLLTVAGRVGLEPSESARTVESGWGNAAGRWPAEAWPGAKAPTAPPHVREALVGPDSPGLMTLDDLDSLPPTRWLIPGMLPEGVNMLYGAYGSMKTFVALDWAMALAAGATGPPRTVVFAAGEGASGLRDRLAAWRRAHSDVAVDPSRLRVRTYGWFPRMNDPPSVDALCQAFELLAEPPGLLVVDTLARSLGGGEEGSADFGRAVAACDDIHNRFGTSTLLVHHSGHDKSRERGWTGLGAACESVWRTEVDDDGRRVRLVNAKQKNGAEHDPLDLRVDLVGPSVVLRPTTYGRLTAAVRRDGGRP